MACGNYVCKDRTAQRPTSRTKAQETNQRSLSMKRSMVKKRSLSLKASLLAMSVLSLMPLAAQADRSSGNAINPNSWVYGPRNDDTSGGRIWNPVKQKMIDGQHVVGRTVQGTFPATTDAFYCSQA